MAKQPKSLNKILVTSAGAAVVAGALAPAAVSAEAADNFTDVSAETRHYVAINALSNMDIISGFPDDTFRPEASLKRVDAAKMIFGAAELSFDGEVDYDFTDVPERAEEYVDALVEEGVIDGFSDTQFGPQENLTREQMAKMIVEAFGFDVAVAVESTFTDRGQTILYPYIDVVADLEIASGYEDGSFGVGDEIKRGDFAAMLYAAMNVGSGDMTVEALGGTVVSTPLGTLAVEVPVDALEGATAETEVTLNVDGEEFTFTYREDRGTFQINNLNGFTEEELMAATVEFDVEGDGGNDDQPMNFGMVSDIDGADAIITPLGTGAIEVPVASLEGTDSESTVVAEIDGEEFELGYRADRESFQNNSFSGYTEEELLSANIWVK
ncbi:S-layer homology domain-containing protein [Halobacillus locisalis]|uniref:S-layer homology domain-containing protein n=1 Tax=Halobacillus locisalis TaxID=220753 RepID=A0A838CTB9_9BACI|nr:S-layer homology domain-containing protein [Halobacillus locisalis]MBA2175317.1 S-layer homology domain-containing protein [Halobacillus locisalis]